MCSRAQRIRAFPLFVFLNLSELFKLLRLARRFLFQLVMVPLLLTQQFPLQCECFLRFFDFCSSPLLRFFPFATRLLLPERFLKLIRALIDEAVIGAFYLSPSLAGRADR